MDKWILKNCQKLSGKKVVVTGATGGLGKIICMDLASLGAYIILACRNKAKADNLKAEILGKYPQTTVDFVPLDLENFESVKNAIEELKKYNGLDILINNAGVYNVPLKKLDSGYNNVFQTNFVYPYFLTRKLLPELEKCQNSTCVVVGSIAHNYSKIDAYDIDFSTHKKNTKIYGNSKRFLMFSMFELFKNSSVNLAVAHPGVTLTNMTNHYPKYINWLVKIGIKLVFPSPKKAVRSIIYATSPNEKFNKPYLRPEQNACIPATQTPTPNFESSNDLTEKTLDVEQVIKKEKTLNIDKPNIFNESNSLSSSTFKQPNLKNDLPKKPYWLGPKLFNIWGNPKFQKLTTATDEEIKKISSITEDIFNKLDK